MQICGVCIPCFVNGGKNNLGLVTGMDEVFLGDSHALDDFAGVFMHFFDEMKWSDILPMPFYCNICNFRFRDSSIM